LGRLSPGGGVLHLPQEYLSAREKTKLDADSRGGVCVPAGSEAHVLLVVGFVFLRALIANLLATWTKSLALDSSPGAARGRQNLKVVAALILCAMQKRYDNVALDDLSPPEPKCAQDHVLQPLRAPQPGECDTCKKNTKVGENVMICQQCDWLLCAACRKAQEAAESSLGASIVAAVGTLPTAPASSSPWWHAFGFDEDTVTEVAERLTRLVRDLAGIVEEPTAATSVGAPAGICSDGDSAFDGHLVPPHVLGRPLDSSGGVVLPSSDASLGAAAPSPAFPAPFPQVTAA